MTAPNTGGADVKDKIIARDYGWIQNLKSTPPPLLPATRRDRDPLAKMGAPTQTASSNIRAMIAPPVVGVAVRPAEIWIVVRV